MYVNLVSNCTHIIRNQVEYNEGTQEMTLHSILEIPATGERLGFTTIDALMDALHTEFTNMQTQIVLHTNLNNKESR